MECHASLLLSAPSLKVSLGVKVLGVVPDGAVVVSKVSFKVHQLRFKFTYLGSEELLRLSHEPGGFLP